MTVIHEKEGPGQTPGDSTGPLALECSDLGRNRFGLRIDIAGKRELLGFLRRSVEPSTTPHGVELLVESHQRAVEPRPTAALARAHDLVGSVDDPLERVAVAKRRGEPAWIIEVQHLAKRRLAVFDVELRVDVVEVPFDGGRADLQ